MSSGLRRHATTIALSVLALGGALVVLIVDRGSVTTEEAQARRRNLLEAIRRDDVTELAITAKGRSARVTRGAPDPNGQRPWQVETGGERYPADEPTVDQILGSLDLGVFERRVPEGSIDRAAAGLNEPRATLALTIDGRSTKVVIGGPAPSPEGAAYAEADGRGLVVITAQLAAALDVDPDRLRARSIVPYAIDELETLDLTGKGGDRRMKRAAWGGSRGPAFRFAGGPNEGDVRVSGPALARVLTALGDLEADAFLPDAEADRALSKDVSITMISRFADSTIGSIDVGGACPGHPGLVVAVRSSPTRISACVPEDVLAGLSTPTADLVDLRLFGAEADSVFEVKLLAGNKSMELARKGTAWKMRSPEEREIEPAQGGGLLDSLLKLEATRITAAAQQAGSAPPSPEALGLSPPRATALLVSTTESSTLDGGPAEARIETIEVGAEQGSIVHIRRLEDGAILELPADHAAVLFPSPVSLRSLAIIDEPCKRIRAISVRSADRVQRLRRGESGWELLEPKGDGLEADVSLVDELCERLGSLTAERWVTAKDDAALGLTKPRLTIDAELGSDNDEADPDSEGDAAPDAGAAKKTLEVLLGAASTEGSFAKLGGDAAAFVAPKELGRAADRWLLDRSTLRVDPASITRVAITGPGGLKAEAERKGDVWTLRNGGDRAPARAAAIRDALADFVAEEAISVGEPQPREGFDSPSLTLDIERARPDGALGPTPKPKTLRIVLGAGDVWRGTRVYYARRTGVAATFAVAQSKVIPLLDAARAE